MRIYKHKLKFPWVAGMNQVCLPAGTIVTVFIQVGAHMTFHHPSIDGHNGNGKVRDMKQYRGGCWFPLSPLFEKPPQEFRPDFENK